MSAEHLLRLAWQAELDGRLGMRDALLTLAVAESGPEDAVLAERCRKQLITWRHDHWFASFPTMGQALCHPKVVDAVGRIRAMYPQVRVERLLMRAEALRGPYTGRARALPRLLDDLFGTRTTEESYSPVERASALPFPGPSPSGASASERIDDSDGVLVFYLTVLLAIAILLASVVPPAAKETKAA